MHRMVYTYTVYTELHVDPAGCCKILSSVLKTGHTAVQCGKLYKLLHSEQLWISSSLYGILSTERCRGETEAMSGVCGITTTSARVCLPRRAQQQWEGVGGYIKRWNVASATKLHPAEYDFVSVARSNTFHLHNINCCLCVYEQKPVTVKDLPPSCRNCSTATMRCFWLVPSSRYSVCYLVLRCALSMNHIVAGSW